MQKREDWEKDGVPGRGVLERVRKGGIWGARSLGKKWWWGAGRSAYTEVDWPTSRVVLLSYFSRWL